MVAEIWLKEKNRTEHFELGVLARVFEFAVPTQELCLRPTSTLQGLARAFPSELQERDRNPYTRERGLFDECVCVWWASE